MSPGDTTSAYELTLLPRMATTVNINTLRGRSFLKHDASNSKKRDVILVFAEGEDAENARREGADIVGGKELIDAVGRHLFLSSASEVFITCDMVYRSSNRPSSQQKSSRLQINSPISPAPLFLVFWVPKV
jgi:hypothetical protein